MKKLLLVILLACSSTLLAAQAGPVCTTKLAGKPCGTVPGGSCIFWSWTAPAGGAAGYNIYSGASSGAENYTAALNGATLIGTTSYEQITPAGVTTYATVTAVSAGGQESAPSPEACAQTPNAQAPPAGFAGTPQ